MTKEEKKKLLFDTWNAGCSCDAMLGWTCSFCKDTLPKLEKKFGMDLDRNYGGINSYTGKSRDV